MIERSVLRDLVGSRSDEHILAALEEHLEERGTLLGLTVEELTQIPGLGPATAKRLVAAIRFGFWVSEAPRKQRIQLCGPDEVAAFFMPRLRHRDREVVEAALLTIKNGLIRVVTVSVGHLSGAPVHPREVFRPAVWSGASSLILAHNHPSGDPTPSPDDWGLHRRLKQAGDILGIRVLDSVIIGDGVWTSLERESGGMSA